MPFPYIQTEYPEVSIVFDYDPVQAFNALKMIFELAVKEKLLIAGIRFEHAVFANILPSAAG